MKDDELYYGFDSDRQQEHEQHIVKEYGLPAEKLLLESKKTPLLNDSTILR